MKLNYLTIMVRDIEESLKFYQELVGLHIIRRFNPEMGKIVFLANAKNETMLELIQFDTGEKVLIRGMVISFEADEKLEVLRLKAVELGYKPTEIITHPTKPKYFRVLDPDGIMVEFS